MGRPRYETEEDRERTRRIRENFEYSTGCTTKGTEDEEECEIDCEVWWRGAHVAEAEVKWRDKQYATYSVADQKIKRLVARAGAKQLFALLIIHWADVNKMGVCDVNKARGTFRAWGGRTDRNDPYDQELMFHIPISSFSIYTPRRPV